MFSTKSIIENLDKETILKYISEEDIFRKYIDYHFELGEIFLSPLRKEDMPSFNIYYNSRLGRIVYKDFAGTSGSAITFVMNKFNLNFTQALKKIATDFNIKEYNIVSNSKVQEQKIKQEKVTNTEFYLIDKVFSKKELEYWNQFGITKEILEFYNVKSVYKLYKNNYLFWTSTESQPIFAYIFPRTGNIKIYRPFGNKFSKWRTVASNELDIQGYDQLPKKGDTIIFTKSMKDVMTLYSLGYSAIATHAEGNYINPDFIRHIKGRFNNLISIYDRDLTGLKGAKYLWKNHDIKPFFISKRYNCKDISEFYQCYGKERTLELLKKWN